MTRIGLVLVILLAGCSKKDKTPAAGSGSSAEAPKPTTPDQPAPPPAAKPTLEYKRTQTELKDIPEIAAKIGLPLIGKGDIDISVNVPNGDWKKAEGAIDLACSPCQIGDDVAKLKLGSSKNANQAAFEGDGIKFGHLNFDKTHAKIEFHDGQANLVVWDFSGPDLELSVEASVVLESKLEASRIGGCIRYRATEAFAKRDPMTNTVLSATGAIRGEDGFFHIKLMGTLGDVRRLSQVCD